MIDLNAWSTLPLHRVVASCGLDRAGGLTSVGSVVAKALGAQSQTSVRGLCFSEGQDGLPDQPDGLQIVLTPRGPILAHMARFFENPALLVRASAGAGEVLPSPSYAVPNMTPAPRPMAGEAPAA